VCLGRPLPPSQSEGAQHYQFHGCVAPRAPVFARGNSNASQSMSLVMRQPDDVYVPRWAQPQPQELVSPQRRVVPAAAKPAPNDRGSSIQLGYFQESSAAFPSKNNNKNGKESTLSQAGEMSLLPGQQARANAQEAREGKNMQFVVHPSPPESGFGQTARLRSVQSHDMSINAEAKYEACARKSSTSLGAGHRSNVVLGRDHENVTVSEAHGSYKFRAPGGAEKAVIAGARIGSEFQWRPYGPHPNVH
ncbi:unnamed protein product, partial [Polarella glacialis]